MHAKKVHIVSLGCPKNLVDSEVMAGILAENGYLLTDRPEEADILLVNTCAFILPAREEAIAEILRMAAWKQAGGGPCTHLVVTGCLPQRYGKELEDGAAGGRSLPRHGGGSPHRPASRRPPFRRRKTDAGAPPSAGRPS